MTERISGSSFAAWVSVLFSRPKLSRRPVSSAIESFHSAFHFKVALGQLSGNWYLAPSKGASSSKARESLDQFTSVAIEQAQGRLERGCKRQPVDLRENPVRPRWKRPGQAIMELVFEVIVLLNAGSDTTESSPTSIVYELAKNENAQRALQAELDGALGPADRNKPGSGLACFEAMKRLPYSQACLDENLRLIPPIPYDPPRVVINPKGIKIAGHHILPGTTVSVPTHTIQRQP